MVVKRRLNCCCSNGFDFPNIPKAPRSTRRKVSSSERDDVDSQLTAFDLLASLAGKLLEESESSSTSTYGDSQDHLAVKIKQEHAYSKPCKSELSHQGNLASKSPSDNTSETCLQVSSLENDCEQTPVSDCKIGHGLKPLEETCVVNVDAGFQQGKATNGLEDGGFIADTISLKDPSHKSDNSDGVPIGSLGGYSNHSKLVCRDDDEKYCKYYKFSDKCKSYRQLTRVKKSRMKKYGRAAPTSRCYEDTRTDGYLKSLYRKRKLCYGYNQWKKHEIVHRKRRLSDKGLVVNSDGGLSSESVTNSPVKRESVKFSIKSFRIPELFIQVPETATVGSLKRTVMEAVTALLGDGIHIGVLVQGKKVRDDNNTLSQTGLSCREKLDNLGFTLEPGSSEIPVISIPTDSTKLSERSAASAELDSIIPLPLQDADHVISSGTCVENSQELVPYQSDITADEQRQPSSDSRAIVPVPSLEPEALAIVPLKRPELSQRRTRRPFSVTEVEALVHAVEELGTGRWRDVKLRSFDDASHRTYVDLKDKWKTLVHTASITPQQRRGEPVPQELLDRVLAAHRYWSQHQVKQNGKHHAMMVVESGLSM